MSFVETSTVIEPEWFVIRSTSYWPQDPGLWVVSTRTIIKWKVHSYISTPGTSDPPTTVQRGEETWSSLIPVSDTLCLLVSGRIQNDQTPPENACHSEPCWMFGHYRWDLEWPDTCVFWFWGLAILLQRIAVLCWGAQTKIWAILEDKGKCNFGRTMGRLGWSKLEKISKIWMSEKKKRIRWMNLENFGGSSHHLLTESKQRPWLGVKPNRIVVYWSTWCWIPVLQALLFLCLGISYLHVPKLAFLCPARADGTTWTLGPQNTSHGTASHTTQHFILSCLHREHSHKQCSWVWLCWAGSTAQGEVGLVGRDGREGRRARTGSRSTLLNPRVISPDSPYASASHQSSARPSSDSES